jgi:urease accessory protein
MLADAQQIRGVKPVIATNLKNGVGVEAVADAISAAVLFPV